jgi:hypothetical protein
MNMRTILKRLKQKNLGVPIEISFMESLGSLASFTIIINPMKNAYIA